MANELTAREEANRFENDLQTFERKLEIVGMSRAMGQVLRDQQMRLPNRQYSGESASRREKQISAASLLQFEYEEERRNLNDLAVYVAELTEGLPEAEVAAISQDLHILASARKEMIETVLDAESSYLRALGDLDFTERRLLAAADAYRAFVSERLLWIRTSEPFSLDTLLAFPSEISRIFAPRQWIDLMIAFPAHLFSSVIPLLMLVIFGILVRAQTNLFALLKSTGDQVGSETRDRLYYSYQALGLTILLALKWPFLMFILGISIKSMPNQTEATGALGLALTNVSYYFFGFEILRLLTDSEGLSKRHFRWPLDTLVPLARGLVSLERIFVPAAVISILSADFYRSEGDSVVSMFALFTAQVALAVFFYRMPSFMASKLDHLLAPGQRTSRSNWGRLIRNLLVLIPCLLIITMLLGYGATSIMFLRLLLLTIALFSGLLIVHEFGIRWLQLIRARFIKAERESARAAATADTTSEDETETFEDSIDDWDTETLDDDGRKLLTVLLGLGAIIGVWIIWADVLPALGILNTIELWDHSVIIDGKELNVPVTLADIALAIMVGFVGYVAVQRTPGLLEMMLRQKLEIRAGTVYASITLFRYGLIILVVVSILGLLGGSWSQIQWAVAALSVGIGFGLQEIVANFICGLILLFEQPIRVGDTVTVGETSGVVTRIRMRATTIRDWDRRELLVPNKEFITGRLLNWSLSDQLTRFDVVVGVAYGTNLKKAMELAIEAAQEHPEVLDDPAPFITFDEFGDNSLQLVLRCFMGSVDKRLTTSSQIRLAVNDKFNQAGIVIAFPQRDVHLDTSVPLEINVRSSLNPNP
jgi:potassium efflux system protein